MLIFIDDFFLDAGDLSAVFDAGNSAFCAGEAKIKRFGAGERMERLYSTILFIFRIIRFLVLPIKIIILNFMVEVRPNILPLDYILLVAGV